MFRHVCCLFSLKYSTSRYFLQGGETGGVRGRGVQPQNLHQRPQPTSGAVRKRVGPTPAFDQGSTKTKRGRRQDKSFGMKNRFGFMFYVVSFFLCPFYYIKKQKFWVKFFVKSTTKKQTKQTNKLK